jgi:RNA polymerase sigma-70 factor (ECF subfamily)
VEGRPPVGNAEDADLVALARDGDVLAYRRLVERYQDLAFRGAYLVVRNTADAEDAAQEAFVKAFYALPRFRIGEPFRPWIMRIVTNEARNRVRAAGRRERLAVRAFTLRGPGDAAPSPDAAVLATELRRALLGALDALPERERLVVIHRYLLDLSEADTAVALGIRPGTVRSRLSRALVRLRDAAPATTLEMRDA